MQQRHTLSYSIIPIVYFIYGQCGAMFRTELGRENTEKLIALVRDGLAACNFNPTQLADLIGIHRTHIYRFLDGKKRLGRDKLESLSRVLSIPYKDVLIAAGYQPREHPVFELSVEELYVALNTLDNIGITASHLRRLQSDKNYAKKFVQLFALIDG